MKRLIIPAISVLALIFSAGTAIAADGGATVETHPVSFLVTWASCPNLAPGTSIDGSGTATSITRTRTDSSGVTTIGNTTHAHGLATDQNGNSYVFNYSNQFRISNTVGNPTRFSGLMTDSFSLAGQGPARLHNGFLAVFSTDASFDEFSFRFVPLISRGDPIKFDDPWAHRCDPL